MSIHYYPLVNKLMNALKLREDLGAHYISEQSDFQFVRPFITVAREPGSGGAPIAQAVAEKLGFTFVDEQIIEEIATSTRKRREIIKEVDEKSRTQIDDIVHSVLNQEYIDDLTYMKELTQVILAYALRGHVVILGRGANFITPFGQGLHVNIVAPYKTRVLRAQEFEGLSEADAKKIIKKVTADREQFIKQYFTKNKKKRTEYDLIINTHSFQVDEARDVVIEAFYRKFSRSVRYGAFFK